MILPSKHLAPGRDLLSSGAELLRKIEGSVTVSELWERVLRDPAVARLIVGFDWFILTLCFLYSIRAIEYDRGTVERATQ
jgi:ABC-3C biological conflict system middle component